MQAGLKLSRSWRATVAACSAMACLLLLVVGCENDAAFEAAERANTPAAWEEYLRQHPDGSNAREARARLAARIDDREWFRADEAHSQAAYESYLRAYPQGIHSHEALLAVANLNLVVPPPKKEAVAEVQLVAPPEPVLRKPSAGAIERASKPGSTTPPHPESSPAAAPAKVAAGDAAKVATPPVASAIKAPRPAPAGPVPLPATQPAVVATETKLKVAAGPAASAPHPAVKSAAAASGPKPTASAAPAKTPPPAPATAPAARPKPVRARPAADSAPAMVAAETPGTEPAGLRPEDARGYRVQLGAFFTEGSATAERVWTQLQSRYTALRERHPIIAAARSADGRSIYRLQVGGLERDAAESLCTSLAAEHDPCIVIAPLKGRAP